MISISIYINSIQAVDLLSQPNDVIAVRLYRRMALRCRRKGEMYVGRDVVAPK